MKKYKELSQMSKSEIDNKIKEIKVEIIKARVASAKGGKVKMKELKKTLAQLLMLQSQRKIEGKN